MKPDVLTARAKMLAAIRDFFHQRGVVEVTTPAIVPHPVSDVHIQSIALTTHPTHHLRTSPEASHKWLLANGMGDLYEMGPVFRSGELGQHHQPEFTLLEWYRLGLDWHQLATEVVELIHHVGRPWHAPWPVRFVSWSDACIETIGVDVANAPPTLWRDWVAPEAAPWPLTDQMDYVFATAVQTTFQPNHITVVHDYPLHQKALAKLSDDGKHALRFEVFIGDIELANGYQELTDADVQRQRFSNDLKERQQRQLPVTSMDERLLAALELGLPACSGVALGVDRLVMALLGLERLDDGYTLSHDHAMVCDVDAND